MFNTIAMFLLIPISFIILKPLIVPHLPGRLVELINGPTGTFILIGYLFLAFVWILYKNSNKKKPRH